MLLKRSGFVKKGKAQHALTNFVKNVDILSQCEQVCAAVAVAPEVPLGAKEKRRWQLPSPFPLAHTLPQVLAEKQIQKLLLESHVLGDVAAVS
jgi:hypothetical protein